MSIYAKEVNKYLTALQNGDATQFKPLYEAMQTHVMGIARYYLIDKSYCEDVTSEVFQKIFLYVNSYTENTDGYNWICRITENIAYDYNSRMPPPSADPAKIDLVAREFAISDDTEEKLDLFRAIDSLEPDSRELIYLRYFLGKTYQEIGEKLNISKVAVKKKIDKILSKLKIFIETGNC